MITMTPSVSDGPGCNNHMSQDTQMISRWKTLQYGKACMDLQQAALYFPLTVRSAAAVLFV